MLIENLAALGAKVRGCSCNIFRTQDRVAAAFAKAGTSAFFAGKGETRTEFWWDREQLKTVPDQDGGDRLGDDGGGAILLRKGEEFEQR